MSESDADKAIEQETAAATPLNRRPRTAPSIFHILTSGIVLCVALLSLIWWRGEPPAMIPTPPRLTETTTETGAEAGTEVTGALTPIPTEPPTAESAAGIPLPTVTPTLVSARVGTRTLEISGQATLRLALSSDDFKSSGRPLPLILEPHTYILGSDIPVIADRWCFQAGVSAVFFDLTMELDQPSGAINVDGEIQLHNGFCDSPGEQTAVSPISLQVPADATAEVVHSLQADSSLFGLSNLLQTSTGIFLELTLRNPRLP